MKKIATTIISRFSPAVRRSISRPLNIFFSPFVDTRRRFNPWIFWTSVVTRDPPPPTYAVVDQLERGGMGRGADN